MGFMQQQITDKKSWLSVETNQGTWFLPKRELGLDYVSRISDANEPDYLQMIDDIQEYCEGKVESWETIQGYGARLSAPGYLDCTEWCVFDTPEKAQEYLDEYYPEDEEEESV